MFSTRYVGALTLLVCALGGCSSPAVQWVRHEPFTADDLHSGCFADADRGWIVTHSTGRVFATADAGRTWRQVGSIDPVYLESVVFTDADHGWMCGEKNAVFHTDDGGRTWIETPLADEPLALGAVRFFSKRRGFAAGTDLANRTAVLYVTDDGGATWCDCTEGISARGLNDAVARSDSGVVLIGGIGAILRSVDDGLSWANATGEVKGIVRGLGFADDNIAWAVGHNGLILCSEDAGQSWRASPQFTNNRLRDVQFIDSRRGYIVGDRNEEPVSLWQTNDGGEAWTPVAGDFPDLHRILLSPTHIYLIGDGGAVYVRHRSP